MPVLTSSLNNKWVWWVQRITIKQFSLQFSFKTFTMTLKPRNITFENQKLLQNVLFSGIWFGQVGLGSMRWDTGTTDHAMKSIMDFKDFCGCLNQTLFDSCFLCSIVVPWSKDSQCRNYGGKVEVVFVVAKNWMSYELLSTITSTMSRNWKWKWSFCVLFLVRNFWSVWNIVMMVVGRWRKKRSRARAAPDHSVYFRSFCSKWSRQFLKITLIF